MEEKIKTFKVGDIVFDKIYFPEVKDGVVTKICNTHIVVKYEGLDFKYTFKGQYIKDDYIFESTLEKSEESNTSFNAILDEYKQRIVNHLLNGRYCITNVSKKFDLNIYTIRFYEDWKEFEIQVSIKTYNIYFRTKDVYLPENDKILSVKGDYCLNKVYGEIKRVLEGKEKLDKIEILKNKIQILKDGLGNEIKKLETELNKLLFEDENSNND
jgi:hypothetical protein|nr:MAG TPA: hypothetical protein [Caudoviricetes sp.]